MGDVVATQQAAPQRVRRRASRAAGPAKTETTDTVSEATVAIEAPAEPTRKAKPAKPSKGLRPPPRRPAHRRLVAGTAAAAAVLAIAGLTVGLLALMGQHRTAHAQQAREQRFVDTATQTVINMFSYTPETIDESVNRFVNGTSGPLRGMLSANNNVDNLKGLFRSTNATSEAVINGAALEGIDTVTDNASVLVSVRVTVADIDGVNKPSMPYRLRVIVHEDDATGQMSGYDLKYPDGGN
ncbi:mammalian cell entry protein [Mycobacterium kubicae]|uniref:mammalian cell entry protein n=1 Tax=Mycobacterium kubicae TaxID=120959 RepID=UPI0007FC3CFE|nr:mammalian cell entry protein [Mycobacterium kubicae]